MEISSTGIADVSAQTTQSAWLVLLTIEHPQLNQPIRLTSDGVITVSQGYVFSPAAFEVILPEDITGRVPIAQLRIDNVSQELIAELRAITGELSTIIQLVRADDSNYIEQEWRGMDIRNISTDPIYITAKLTTEDLTKEEFPFETLDGRWIGLFP